MEIDFSQPAPQAKTLEEAQEIINALWQICRELSARIDQQQKKIEALEERLTINSKNSSTPPSSERFKSGNKSSKKNKRHTDGQPGHNGVSRRLLPEASVSHIVHHQPPEYCVCGGHIQSTPSYRRHQVHELPPVKVVVTEHQLFSGCCEKCGKTYQANLPSTVPTGILGPCLLAFIATLTSDYKMSKRDVTRFLLESYNLSICIATVKRAEETVSAVLAAPVEEAKTYVKAQTRVNCDETSHAECGKKRWTWVAISNRVAVFMIAKSRSASVAKALLGETFKGILGSDRYSAYAWLPVYFRQVCWAHLKRDFKKIAERAGQSKRIGLRLLVYTKRLFHNWHQVRAGTLTRKQFKKLMRPLRYKVESLLMAGTTVENSKTKRTCLEMLKMKSAFWTFIDKVGVEPTNNIAERVLRKMVIWRKVSFGTWSENGTDYLERVMTVVATCHLQERSVFGFLREAMQAHFDGKKAPSLLPVAIST